VRFDVDNFHLINSFWGEEEGNRFLQFIADEMRRMAKLTSPATYGRISADTFCMCIPFDPDFIDRCLEAAKKDLSDYNPNYLIKSSTGIYVIEDPSESVERMYEWSTLAARECKGKYKTFVSYYKPEMSQKAMLEQTIVHEMQHALDNEQFEVFLQPKYNLETSQPYGAEALIRWRHPEKGLISPGVFIPVFERNGFIDKIDQYMWEKTCQLLRKWIDEGKKPAPISVNVSRVNIYNPNLVGAADGARAEIRTGAGLT
jgi:predicted signal transduction protein with EAL and GGDEF domain